MGELHVRAWQAAYRDVISAEYLDGLSPRDRAAMWRDIISQAPDRVLVAEREAAVIGFAAFGQALSGIDSLAGVAVGELFALNIDPSHWGEGAGRALLAEVMRRLREGGWSDAVLWVVASNTRARRLYESAGWLADGSERTELLGVVVVEVRYACSLGAAQDKRGPEAEPCNEA